MKYQINITRAPNNFYLGLCGVVLGFLLSQMFGAIPVIVIGLTMLLLIRAFD